MTRTEFTGASYGFLLPDRTFGVVIEGSHIQTSRGRVEFPGEDLLRLDGTIWRDVLWLAGEGHGTGHAWLWNGSSWHDFGPTHGVETCAFGTGILCFAISGDTYRTINLDTGEVTDGHGAFGSQGIRYVNEQNVPVPGDATLFDGTVHEFTDRGDVRVGQGHEGGTLANGRLVEDGECFFPKFKRDGDRLGIYLVQFAKGRGVGHLLSRAEVESLPMPTDPRSTRFWYQSNMAADGLIQIFDDPELLKQFGVFSLYMQNVTSTGPEVGPNTFDALQANHAFQKLKQAGVPLNLEGMSLSDLDAVQKIRDAKGDVTYFAFSEPITELKSVQAAADAFVAFYQKAASIGVQAGYLEAWPEVDLSKQQALLDNVIARGCKPAFWHMDTDHVRAQHEGKDVAAMLKQARAYADAHGVTFGCFVNSTVDPILTDAQHAANIQALATKIHGIMPDLAHVHLASWARRVKDGPQTVPNNFGANGLLESYDSVRTIFGGGQPEPIPEPVPPPEIVMTMAYSLPVPGFLAGALEPHPDGGGAVLVRKPNGKVLCITPAGAVEERDNAGPWEKFTRSKNGASLIAERETEHGSAVYVLALCE
jgi:hypothetical protein